MFRRSKSWIREVPGSMSVSAQDDPHPCGEEMRFVAERPLVESDH
jgi:hypothetical protein